MKTQTAEGRAFLRLGLRLDIEVSVIGPDRHDLDASTSVPHGRLTPESADERASRAGPVRQRPGTSLAPLVLVFRSDFR